MSGGGDAIEACNSQESDTFGSLDPHLPEAGQVSSQMPEGSSQELPFEVDTSGSQQGPSQMSTEGSEHSAEESLQGNFPAVNIAPSGKNSPPNKKGGDAAKGKGVAASGKGKGKDAKDSDAKDKSAKDSKDAKADAAATAAAPEKGVKAAAGKKGNGKSAPPMEAEVDAADVLLSLSMSAARRSGRNPTEPLPPAQAGRPAKRCPLQPLV